MSQVFDKEILKARYRELFSSPTGQEVLIDLIETVKMWQTCHVPGDPCETAYRSGQQDTVLYILGLLGSRADAAWMNQRLDAARRHSLEIDAAKAAEEADAARRDW